jgi:hypothetical protein
LPLPLAGLSEPEVAMARAIWKGVIQLGTAEVPVKLSGHNPTSVCCTRASWSRSGSGW